MGVDVDGCHRVHNFIYFGTNSPRGFNVAEIYKEIPESSRRPVIDGLTSTGIDEVTRIDVKHLNMKNSSATEPM